jgi:hypothetical protein
MKKKLSWIALLMGLLVLAFGCSAVPMDESLGAEQEAIGTCSRPTGSAGDTVWPVDSYVSAIGVDPTASWRLMVKSKLVASPFTVTTSYIDFGGVSTVNSQAKITGTGWSSGAGRKIDEVMYLNSTDAYAQTWGCANDPNLVCMLISETTGSDYFPILYFDKAYAYPGNEHIGCGAGLTALVGMGATLPQKLRHYFDYGGGTGPLGYRSTVFSGPKLDACAYP